MSGMDTFPSEEAGGRNERATEAVRAAADSAWLRLYAGGLALLIPAYHGGMAGLALLCFGAGGWLRWLGAPAEPARAGGGWAGFLRRLGAPDPLEAGQDPDARLGPLVCRADAAALFRLVGQATRQVGGDFPSQIRLSYLPCCGVLELLDPTRWNARRQVLVIGLPLLYVLNVDELRAVVAHELVHLSRGDAAAARRVTRFLASLGGAARDAGIARFNPLVLYCRGSHAAFRALAAPVSRHMEFRADRVAGSLLGSNILGSALLKTALVQPLFKELLDYYHPARCGRKNLYQFFRAFWARLPAEQRRRLEQSVLAGRRAVWNDEHPGLADRMARLARLPRRSLQDCRPACHLVDALDAFEALLHNRIFGERQPPAGLPSTFHRAGS